MFPLLNTINYYSKERYATKSAINECSIKSQTFQQSNPHKKGRPAGGGAETPSGHKPAPNASLNMRSTAPRDAIVSVSIVETSL